MAQNQFVIEFKHSTAPHLTAQEAILKRLQAQAAAGNTAAARILTIIWMEGDRLERLNKERMLDADKVPMGMVNRKRSPSKLAARAKASLLRSTRRQGAVLWAVLPQDKRIQDQMRQALVKVQEKCDVLFATLKGKRIGPKRRQALLLEYCEKLEFRDQLVRELRPGRVDGRPADANIQ